MLFIGYELHFDYYKFALPYSLAGAFVVLAITTAAYFLYDPYRVARRRIDAKSMIRTVEKSARKQVKKNQKILEKQDVKQQRLLKRQEKKYRVGLRNFGRK